MVTAAFSEWPSFDDFEVVSFLLERGEEFCPVITALLAGTDKGETSHWLLTIRFVGVDNLKMEGFNHQNAINGISISDKWSDLLNRTVFSVEIIKGFGLGASFECEQIKVLTIKPALPPQ
jgi:hypothetical protein